MKQNFLSLSPHEFETLAADIVGVIHDVYVEKFGEGIDGGTDGRVCMPSGDKWIVQAKRYKSTSGLSSQMAQENNSKF